jgi:hypothetical protein
MNRRWQLERTLARNLRVLRGTRHFLALCNFNSRDGLDAYVRRQYPGDCERGTLVYFHTTGPSRFHVSRAKNTAHRLAIARGATVLFNLDADNFLTPAGVAQLVRRFSRQPNLIVHEWSGRWDGTLGRIALSATAWQSLGGYDETFEAMESEDFDLMMRARAIGLVYRRVHGDTRPPIQNSMQDKVINTEVGRVSERRAREAIKTFNNRNLRQSLMRPISWPTSVQQRYNGRLNLDSFTRI